MVMITNEQVIAMAKEKVGYYWEEGNYPVLEVFITGTESEVRKMEEDLDTFLHEHGISKDIMETGYSSFQPDYHRILCVFDFDNTSEGHMQTVVDYMAKLGEPAIDLSRL